jgi:hypothetical protein
VSVSVTIRRYDSVDEGRVAWALLRSAGIDALLDGHETCSLLGAVGDLVGVALRVPESQAEDSVAALLYVESGAFMLPDDLAA